MIETKTIDPEYMESVFFDTPYKFSFTSMNRLLEAPRIFYDEYILKNREIRDDKHLVMGQLIHFFVLENTNFDERFIVIPEGVPTGKTKDVIALVHAAYIQRDLKCGLEDLKEEILEAMKEVDLYQNFTDDEKKNVTGDEKRLDKIISPKTIEYFKCLTADASQTLIDSGMLDKATRSAELVRANEKIVELLGLEKENDQTKYVAYNEFQLEMDLEKLPFGLKGVIDNMSVDVENKTLTINDFKTTGKSVTNFQESVEYWRYWLQAVFYRKLAVNYWSEYIPNLETEWTINFNFIVIDTYNQLYAYPVSNETMSAWTERSNEIFEQAVYHFESRDFSLPFKFATGSVVL